MPIFHEGPYPRVMAGDYPPQLLDVCKVWGTVPAALAGWTVTKHEVSITLPGGVRASVMVVGEWGKGKEPAADEPEPEDEPEDIKAAVARLREISRRIEENDL